MGRWVNRRNTHSHRPRNADHDNSLSPTTYDTDLEDAAGRIDYHDANSDLGEVPLSEIDNFFVPGRDSKGASQAITIHVPPYLARLCAVLVHSKRFPYCNVEDLVRHATVRQLKWLCSIRTTIQPQMTPMLEAVQDADRDADFRIKAEAAFHDIDRRIDYYMRNQEQGEAIKLIGFIMARVQEVEGSARQREFIRTCLVKYSRVMAGVEGWEEAFRAKERELDLEEGKIK